MKKKNLIFVIIFLSISLLLIGLFVYLNLNKETKFYCTSGKNTFCTEQYSPVCGWADKTIQCFRYPCAQTFSNACFACADEKTEYYTIGECPA